MFAPRLKRPSESGTRPEPKQAFQRVDTRSGREEDVGDSRAPADRKTWMRALRVNKPTSGSQASSCQSGGITEASQKECQLINVTLKSLDMFCSGKTAEEPATVRKRPNYDNRLRAMSAKGTFARRFPVCHVFLQQLFPQCLVIITQASSEHWFLFVCT